MTLHVGDRVKVNCYEGKEVYGTVTKVAKERTRDWKFFQQCRVIYDYPVLKNFPSGWLQVIEGQHLYSEVELCT